MYVSEKAMAPAELTLFAFGGAGPVHAIGLARKLGCPRVVVPPFSGVMSSLGLLAAPIAFERSRAIRRLVRELAFVDIEAAYVALETEAKSLLPEPSVAVIQRTADFRYSGQDYALEIDTDAPCTTPLTPERWEQLFLAAYQEFYGKVDDDNPIELASVRVYARQMATPPRIAPPARAPFGRPKASRPVHFAESGGFAPTPVYERDHLQPGQLINGPAVIEERVATTLLGPGDVMTVDAAGCLVITLAATVTGDAARTPHRSPAPSEKP